MLYTVLLVLTHMIICVSVVLKHGPRSFELAFLDLYNNGKQIHLLVIAYGSYKSDVFILKLFIFA
jgi:hypothetical protein